MEASDNCQSGISEMHEPSEYPQLGRKRIDRFRSSNRQTQTVGNQLSPGHKLLLYPGEEAARFKNFQLQARILQFLIAKTCATCLIY